MKELDMTWIETHQNANNEIFRNINSLHLLGNYLTNSGLPKMGKMLKL